MTATFEQYLHGQTQLSDADILQISSLAIHRKLQRNELLLRAGEICRHKTFVISGLLRMYSIAGDGTEPILQFAPELSWILDAESYDQKQPSRYNIAAVEPSEILIWTKPSFDQALADIPALKKYAEQLISRNSYSGRQRLLTALSASPGEKYQEFVRNSPDLLARLPLHMIAAYLGMSIKTLTRIRHSQWAS